MPLVTRISVKIQHQSSGSRAQIARLLYQSPTLTTGLLRRFRSVAPSSTTAASRRTVPVGSVARSPVALRQIQAPSAVRWFATKPAMTEAQKQAIKERKKAEKKKKGPTPIQKKQRARVNVVLTNKVHPTGEKGEELFVSKGFARNYLFARGLAVHANAETRAQYAEDAKKIDKGARERRRISEKAKKRIKKITVHMKRQEVDPSTHKMHAPVTSANIIDKLQKQHRIELNPSELLLETPLTTYGEHKVKVRTGELVSEMTVAIAKR